VKGLGRRKNLLIIVLVALLIVTNLVWGGLFWLNQRYYAQLDKLKVFLDVYNSILNRYVEEVSSEQLIDAATRAMVDSLGDPHSFYLDPKEYDLFMKEVNKSFEGVGMYIGMEDNRLTVIGPIEGSPADKAGIKKGDVIVKIDDQETSGLKVDEAVKLISGPEGTKVKLTIERPGQDNLLEVVITRAKINLKTVSGGMVADNIGYIRMTTFAEKTTEEFKNMIKELRKNDLKGLILDLRDNPGGYLEVSVDIADYFIPQGPVVSIKSRDGQEKVYKASGKNYLNLPVAVLINGGSASASEILSGAIQDLQTGIIIGEKSYGKGSVQSILNLENGAGLKLTTALYYTPSGRSIEKKGIVPDLVVKLPANSEKDLQLEKAVEVIKERIAAAAGS